MSTYAVSIPGRDQSRLPAFGEISEALFYAYEQAVPEGHIATVLRVDGPDDNVAFTRVCHITPPSTLPEGT